MLLQHGAPRERHSHSAGSVETGISALQGPRHERVLQHGAPGEGYFCSTGLDSTSLKIFGLKIAHACSAGAFHVPPCPPHAPVLVWAGSGPGCSIPSAPLPQHPHLGQYRSSCPRALLFVAIMIFWTCFGSCFINIVYFPRVSSSVPHGLAQKAAQATSVTFGFLLLLLRDPHTLCNNSN